MFHLYGLIVGVAIVSAWSVAERIEPRINKTAPWVLVFGILGARAYHVIDLWEYYQADTPGVLRIWEGGLGILGGIVGGGVGYWLGTRNQERGIRWNQLSAIVTGLPLAQAIGRWGNLANDELWGRGGQPLFLYESVMDLILFGILWSKKPRGRTPRQTVATYLVGYGLIRLLLEGLRVNPWVVDYWVAWGMVGLGVVLWLDTKRRRL